jgi:hypothetical protein
MMLGTQASVMARGTNSDVRNFDGGSVNTQLALRSATGGQLLEALCVLSWCNTSHLLEHACQMALISETDGGGDL